MNGQMAVTTCGAFRPELGSSLTHAGEKLERDRLSTERVRGLKARMRRKPAIQIFLGIQLHEARMLSESTGPAPKLRPCPIPRPSFSR